ncbi:MAG: hypothetical protein Fur006_54550 [Coleofasciculaceae cyanobacterium]
MFATLGNAVQGYFEKAKCTQLRKELLTLVRCRHDAAERLITLAKRKNPGKAKRWYLEKVIWDLKRGR